MKNKEEAVEKLMREIKCVMHESLHKEELEKAMASISVGCQILYEYNQYYMDEDFENGVVTLSEILGRQYNNRLKSSYKANNNVVLFYDGFGLDSRGVAQMYLNALAKNDYQIVYVTGITAERGLHETKKILTEANAQIYYIDNTTKYVKWAKELLNIILSTEPKAMFFYTTPYDVSGAVAFALMEGKTERFLIDLTDHAFWLGVKCNDFFCGSREMSASNQVYERGIPREKLIKLGVNLIVYEEEKNHSGLPFDVEKKQYVFSGGALYKTLGDKELLYYKIVDHILGNHKDVFFLYAGDGDRTEMDKILEKYAGRAYLIPERKDFYYLIKHCTIYLNTYPMFGGMMMKYAANAGKLPITLKHENDADGLLLDQKSRRIEYDTYEELIDDMDILLSDNKYLADREKLLEGSVISEERFIRNVRSTIEEHCTDYTHGQEHIDTTKFKKEFRDRFDLNVVKSRVSRSINKSLYFCFPWMLGKHIRRGIKLLVAKVYR